MRTTSSFEVFPNEPSQRELAHARWLRRQGNMSEAEASYREVISRQPALRSAWTECFELLRAEKKLDQAFELAAEAERIFATEAFPLALKAAALIEQDRLRDALRALEAAVERDPDLALTWHELGHAAYRLGDGNRALLALDRAFALEPHTETLVLRGKILRDAGQFYAAEVAFEGALHSIAHEGQEADIKNEIMVTRRLGAFPPKWARTLTAAEEWFGAHGAVVLAAAGGTRAPTDTELAHAFTELARDRGWQFGQLLTVGDNASWTLLAARLGLQPDPNPAHLDPTRIPLLVTEHVDPRNAGWSSAVSRIETEARGATLALRHPIEISPAADVVGALERDGATMPSCPDPATALVMAQHPACRLAHRVLKPSSSPAALDEPSAPPSFPSR